MIHIGNVGDNAPVAQHASFNPPLLSISVDCILSADRFCTSVTHRLFDGSVMLSKSLLLALYNYPRLVITHHQYVDAVSFRSNFNRVLKTQVFDMYPIVPDQLKCTPLPNGFFVYVQPPIFLQQMGKQIGIRGDLTKSFTIKFSNPSSFPRSNPCRDV